MRVLAEYEPGCTVCVDGVGIGSSVVDQLGDRGVNVAGINAGAGTKAVEPVLKMGFTNLKAWLTWNLRTLLDPSNPNPIALPPDKLLARELSMFRYSMKFGKIAVESKDDVKKRLKRSPDLAEAVLLAAIAGNTSIARSNAHMRQLIRHAMDLERRARELKRLGLG